MKCGNKSKLLMSRFYWLFPKLVEMLIKICYNYIQKVGVYYMQDYINMLGDNLLLLNIENDEDTIIFTIKSTNEEPICPYCGQKISRCHSIYSKTFDDLPLNNKRVILKVLNKKMFCDNANCKHKTFAETFNFVERKSKKTIRLKEYILDVSSTTSSILAQNLLRKNGIKIGKSTICTYLKKR